MIRHSIRLRRIFMSLLLLASMAGCAANSVEENSSQYLQDSAITSAVKQKIAGDPDLKNVQITVETNAGVVQLSGFVNSTDTAARAEELARSVRNVSEVKNRLVVKGSG
jgi:osmotically-inducible protein OsmY